MSFRFQLDPSSLGPGLENGTIPVEVPVNWVKIFPIGNPSLKIDWQGSRMIGQGGYGQVFSDAADNIVVKIIDFPAGEVSADRPRGGEYSFCKHLENSVGREAEMQARASEILVDGSPVAPPVYGAAVYRIGEENCKGIIVMKKISGITFASASPEEKQRVKDKLRAKILAMNERGIFHNDLHNENILIEEGTNEPYLLDFGLAGDKDISLAHYEQGSRMYTNIQNGREPNIEKFMKV